MEVDKRNIILLENLKHKILWKFEISTHPSIQVRIPDPLNSQEKCPEIVVCVLLTDNRENKENEKLGKENMYTV